LTIRFSIVISMAVVRHRGRTFDVWALNPFDWRTGWICRTGRMGGRLHDISAQPGRPAVAALSLSAAAFALPAQGQQQPSTAIAELAFPGSVLR
jgi:hypothetical protein